jgi:hypothetical protein
MALSLNDIPDIILVHFPKPNPNSCTTEYINGVPCTECWGACDSGCWQLSEQDRLQWRQNNLQSALNKN